MSPQLTTNERLEKIEEALHRTMVEVREHDRELADHDARLEEVEVSDGLIDDEPEDLFGTVDEIERISIIDGAELWVSTDHSGTFLLTSERLRDKSETFDGVWITLDTLSDLAKIAEIEIEERGED